MANQEELKKIAVKSIEDDEFRSLLETDPAAAAASLDITLTDEQVESIKAGASKAAEAGSRESKGIVGSVVTHF